jgi:hypothetical protein
MDIESEDSFKKLSSALRQLPDLSAPKNIEAIVMNAVLALPNTPSSKASRRRAYIQNSILVLSSPIWIWLSLEAQRWSMNELIWNVITINDRVPISKLMIHWFSALTPMATAVVILALMSAVTVYIGISSILWSMLQVSKMQGKSI